MPERADEWRGVREFGTPPDRTGCILRPSAYGFLLDARRRLAIVRAPDGVYLPGGGIDEGESPEQAVVRETIEECGLLVRVGGLVNRAIQWVIKENSCFEKRSSFYRVDVEGEVSAGRLPGHETMWMSPAEVGRILTHESQVWAVDDWRGRV